MRASFAVSYFRKFSTVSEGSHSDDGEEGNDSLDLMDLGRVHRLASSVELARVS